MAGSMFIPSDGILTEEKTGIRTVVTPVTGSTNKDLLSRIRGGDTSAVIITAHRQTGGRGRLGRSFSSEEGGIYFSFNFPIPVKDAHLISCVTPAAGVAAAAALRSLYGADVRLKWVNDLILGGKKLGGILSESLTVKDTVHVVVGIGINVSNTDLPPVATSLSEHICGRFSADDVIAETVNGFFERLPAIGSIADEYRDLICHLGCSVTVHTFDGAEDYHARALDVTSDCRLKVLPEDGRVRYLSSGEVSIRF